MADIPKALHVTQHQVSLAERLPQIEAQIARLSTKHPARRVLWIAGQMLVALADELIALRAQAPTEKATAHADH